MVKNLPAMQETWVLILGWKDPLEKAWLPTPIFLPEEFHGQRRLADPVMPGSWGHQGSDTKGQTQLSDYHFHFTFKGVKVYIEI